MKIKCLKFLQENSFSCLGVKFLNFPCNLASWHEKKMSACICCEQKISGNFASCRLNEVRCSSSYYRGKGLYRLPSAPDTIILISDKQIFISMLRQNNVPLCGRLTVLRIREYVILAKWSSRIHPPIKYISISILAAGKDEDYSLVPVERRS